LPAPVCANTGLDDLIVGALGPEKGVHPGKSYVIFGKTDTNALNILNADIADVG
jgi:hypothetical protein